MQYEKVLPNTIGAQLVRCTVAVEQDPPTVSSSVEMLPILGFGVDESGAVFPVTIASPVFWRELRAAVAGCCVYGISTDLNECVATHDHHFPSLEDFVGWAERAAANEIAEVRRDKGWPENTWPAPLLEA